MISDYTPTILKVLIEARNKLKTEFRHPTFTSKLTRIDVKVEGERYTYLITREDNGNVLETIIGCGGTTFMKSTFKILQSSLQ